jgi:hypothetical protein
MNTQYLSTPLKNIVDTDLLSLMTELEEVTGVKRILNYDLPFGMYLCDCLRPNGADFPPILITPEMLRRAVDLSVLNKQIRKFHDTQIYCLFDEIAKSQGLSIENVSRKLIYTFINQSYKAPPKIKKKSKQVNRLWR